MTDWFIINIISTSEIYSTCKWYPHFWNQKIRSLQYILELWSYYQEWYVMAHIFWSFDGLDSTRTLNISHALSFIFHLHMPFSTTVRYLIDGRVSLKSYNHKNSRFFPFQHNFNEIFFFWLSNEFIYGKNINVRRSLQSIWKKKRILGVRQIRMIFYQQWFFNKIYKIMWCKLALMIR